MRESDVYFFYVTSFKINHLPSTSQGLRQEQGSDPTPPDWWDQYPWGWWCSKMKAAISCLNDCVEHSHPSNKGLWWILVFDICISISIQQSMKGLHPAQGLVTITEDVESVLLLGHLQLSSQVLNDHLSVTIVVCFLYLIWGLLLWMIKSVKLQPFFIHQTTFKI